MSSYDDPRWYEQERPQDKNLPSAEDANFNGFSEFPAPAPNYNRPPQQGINTHIPQPIPQSRNRGWRITRNILIVSLLMVIAFSGGWFANHAIFDSFNPSDQSASYSRLYQQAWNIVDQNYVDRKAVNYKNMSYKSIQAMLDVLQDSGHTRFLTPADVKAENQQLSGKFTGIGVYLRQDQTTKEVIIVSTIPGSPAEKAGFKHGDVIVAVAGTSTVGKDIEFISNLIHGDAGTSVSITVQRGTPPQSLTISVVRADITVQNVLFHYIAEDHIADIQIVQFADGISSQLKDDLVQAKKEGATSIILDLRDNPGGYLSEAINTASLFLKSGNVLLEQDSSGQRTPYSVTGDPIDTTSPMVVLVNNGTASAAEIVSGALQDNGRAIILGEATFGTGTVLREFDLADGSAILLGVSEWLTPKGHFIRTDKIQPTTGYQVTLPSNMTPITPNDENADGMTEQQILNSGDTQLVAAIHYLQTHPAKSSTDSQAAQAQQQKHPIGQLALEPGLWSPTA